MPQQPAKRLVEWLIPAALLLLALLVSLRGLSEIPFHPDESSYLFMSADLERLLQHPLTLAFDPSRYGDRRAAREYPLAHLRQIYRLRDAPLNRYLIGLGRLVLRQPALLRDWDWSLSWEENQAAGALPSPQLLYAGRLATALLLPFSVLFLYLCGRQIGGIWTGVIAALLLLLNALVLLHTRRAMAEGALLLGICLALYGMLRGDRLPWLAGLGAALALSAKLSALPLVLVGLAAVLWLSEKVPHPNRQRFTNLLQYLGVLILVFWLLNPVYWRSPLQALQVSWHERQALLELQVEINSALAPEQVLSSPAQRVFSLLANLYFTPPAFAEAGNYRNQTAAAEAAYLSLPGNNLLRSLPGGGLLLFLSLVGAVLGLVNLRRETPAGRRRIALVLLTSAALAGGLLLAIPLSWQRYVLPLVPLVCLWAGYAAGRLAQILANSIR